MEKSKKRKKKRLSTGKRVLVAFLLVVIIGGVGMALFPTVYGNYLNSVANQDIEEFLTLAQTVQSTITTTVNDDGDVETEMLYQDLYAAIQEYNEFIYDDGQSGVAEIDAYTASAFTLSDWGLDSEVFGVVQIPSLDISMPLYLGASSNNLALGTAQLYWTSIPIGGINTNSVIAGHCSWRGANYFRYLCNISIGDYVFITNLWETLVYQVVETEIIDPTDSEKILIQEGKDMVTLFTCHPYASGGKYRFMAYCERVEDVTEEIMSLILE